MAEAEAEMLASRRSQDQWPQGQRFGLITRQGQKFGAKAMWGQLFGHCAETSQKVYINPTTKSKYFLVSRKVSYGILDILQHYTMTWERYFLFKMKTGKYLLLFSYILHSQNIYIIF